MTLNELRYIVAVAHERSFGRAAQRCFVSQPALSVAIQKLEEELGTRLFERGKAEVSVTPVGERIVEQAQKVLEEAARVKELAQAGRNQLSGPLRLGAIYTVAPYLLPDLIPALHELAPQMPLEIEENLTENLEAALKSGRVDAAIVALPFDPPGIVTEFLYEEPFRIVVPRGHKWAKRKSVPADELATRAHDPAGHRPLLPRPGARRLPGAQPHGVAGHAREFARNRAQHGGVGTRRFGAAAGRDDAEIPQPARGSGAVHATDPVAANRARVAEELSAAAGDPRDPRRGRRVPAGTQKVGSDPTFLGLHGVRLADGRMGAPCSVAAPSAGAPRGAQARRFSVGMPYCRGPMRAASSRG